MYSLLDSELVYTKYGRIMDITEGLIGLYWFSDFQKSTFSSVDNYLSSFPGVANHSKAVTGGQVDDLIVPPLLLLPPFLPLSPSSNLPFLLLSSFSFLLSTRSAGTGGTHLFPLLYFFLLLSPLAPLSLLSLLFPSSFLLSASFSLSTTFFLPSCSSFLLAPLPS